MISDKRETAIREVESDIGTLYIGCEGEYPIILVLEIEGGEMLYGMTDEYDLQSLINLLRRGLKGTP